MRRHMLRTFFCVLGLVLSLAPLPALAETSEEVRAEVASTQAELDALAAQIAEGEARVTELQAEVDQLADESVELQTSIIQNRDRLAKIVAEGYKSNYDAHTLALLLSSRSVDELISQVYYAQKVSEWETECIEQLNADKASLDARMSQINQAKSEQAAEVEALNAQREELDATVAALNEKADRLEEEEREAARKAAEEAARKAAEEKARREAEEKARRDALAAAQAAGDVTVVPTQGGDGWITCIASAYTIADNDPPGSTATSSGIPLDESVPTVAMPMSMNPSRFYGSKIEISYNGMSVIATVTDCGYMGGGSRGLDLTPAVFRAFGFSSANDWGLRQVSYRFL